MKFTSRYNKFVTFALLALVGYVFFYFVIFAPDIINSLSEPQVVKADGVEAKDIKNAGQTYKKEWVTATMDGAKKYHILPSLIICQLYVESNWGGAGKAATVDNNLSGIKMPGAKSGVKVTTGTSVTELGHTSQYAHYNSIEDYFTDYLYLLRKGNNYNVADQADWNTAVKGLFTVGGAKANYAEAGYTAYNAGLTATRSAINKQNNNYLDQLDKEAYKDGQWQGSIESASKQSDNTAQAVQTLKSDDTFTVNGYGALSAKDWQEQVNLAKEYIESQEPEKDFTSKQKNNINDWEDQYSNTMSATVISYSRIVISVAGFGIILYCIALTIAFAFDRLGVLDFSAVSFLTSDHMTTGYQKDESTFFKSGNKGETKVIVTKDLMIINLVGVMIATLIINGNIFMIAYQLYEFAYNFIKFGNTLH